MRSKAAAPTAGFVFAYMALAALNVGIAVSQGQWAAGSLSSARYLLAATSVRDQVIFAGGGSSSALCAVDRYSALTDSWTQECLSVGRSWLSAASISWPAPSTAAFSLVAGGFFASTPSSRIDIFNAETLSWSVAPVNLSIPRFSMAAASLDSLSLIFFAGGRSVVGSIVYATVDVLRISSSGSISVSVSSMVTPRHGLSATSLPQQSIAMFAGGMNTLGFASNVVDIYNAGTQEWTVASLSVARVYLAATALPSYSLAFFAGGWTGSNTIGNCSKVVDIYNGVTKTWSQATLSVARHHLAAAALDLQGIVVFAGGLKAAISTFTGQYANDVDIFTASTSSWTTHTLAQARSFLVPAVLPLRGLLYFGGGFTGAVSDQIDIWDVRTDSLGPLSPAITLSNPARRGTGISMTVAMAPAIAIPVNAKIVITLSGIFSCSNGTNVLFSPPGNPVRTGAVSIAGSLMTITLLSGNFLGSSSFIMTFAGVTNPSVSQPSSSTVNAATLNENGLIIGSSSIGTLVAVVPNLGPAAPSISLSSVLASQTQVTMTFTLLPECSIPSTGRLLMTLSGSGWNLAASTPVSFLSPSSGAVASASLASSSHSAVLSVQFSSGQFPANTRVAFSISGFTNPSVAQAPTPNVNDASPQPLRVASAVTDVFSVTTCASFEGSIPAIIDKLGCNQDFYFVEASSRCEACASDYTAPQGSVGDVCTFKLASQLLWGFGISIPLALIIGFGIWFYLHRLERQRMLSRQHPLLKKLLPDRLDLLEETARAHWTGVGDDSIPEKLQFIDVDPQSAFFKFVQSKMRTKELNPLTTMNISRIQMVRLKRERAYCEDIENESRSVTQRGDKLLPQKPPPRDESHSEFYAALHYFDSQCERTPPDWSGTKVVFAWHGSNSKNIESLCENNPRSFRITDGGFFGSGAYFALECAYASRYSEWNKYPAHYPVDHPSAGQPHPQAGEPIPNEKGEFGVILYSCCVAPFPYVITLEKDYDAEYHPDPPPFRRFAENFGFSSFYSENPERSKALKRLYNAHFVPVKYYGDKNPKTGNKWRKDPSHDWMNFDYQACPESNNPEGHELVLEQVVQMLAVAVLWYKK